LVGIRRQRPGLPCPGAGIGEHDDHVDDQVGDQHGERDHQEDPLHERVVVRGDRVEQQQPDARVGEDDLHDQGARDHEADRQAEPLQLGQQGVASRVGEDDAPVGQALGLGRDHVVLADRGDHDVAHLQHPPGDRGEHDGERRQQRVVEGAADEVPVPARDQPVVVSLAGREDMRLDGEQLDQDQREEEVRDGLQEHQAGQHAVERAAVPPAGHDAERGPHQEGDDGRGADQDDGPRERLDQERGDRRRVLGYVGAEVEVEDVVQVRHVLTPDRARMSHPQQRLDGLVGRGLQVGELRHHALHGVARHRPRDEEVDGQRHPRGDEVEHQAAEYERHGGS
jgi:hypothetical protein